MAQKMKQREDAKRGKLEERLGTKGAWGVYMMAEGDEDAEEAGTESAAAIAVGIGAGAGRAGQCTRVAAGDGNSRSWVHQLDVKPTSSKSPFFVVLLSTMLTEADGTERAPL